MITLDKFIAGAHWHIVDDSNEGNSIEQIRRLHRNVLEVSDVDDCGELCNFDVSLWAIVSGLLYNGLTIKDINDRISSGYIDIFYLDTQGVYCLVTF